MQWINKKKNVNFLRPGIKPLFKNDFYNWHHDVISSLPFLKIFVITATLVGIVCTNKVQKLQYEAALYVM